MKFKFPKNSNFKFATKFVNFKSRDFGNLLSYFAKFGSIKIVLHELTKVAIGSSFASFR